MRGMTETTKRVLLAAPRRYCAGVDRAVVTVEKALELYGPPVYVREIVHNKRGDHAAEAWGGLRRRPTRFPRCDGHLLGHGVAPVVHEEAKRSAGPSTRPARS